MTILNAYDIEFFELINHCKKDTIDKDFLLKKLLKLNNPTYYSKFITKNPLERHGFSNTTIKNPILIAVQNMLAALKNAENSKNLLKQLQVELCWAYHNYPLYKRIDL